VSDATPAATPNAPVSDAIRPIASPSPPTPSSNSEQRNVGIISGRDFACPAPLDVNRRNATPPVLPQLWASQPRTMTPNTSYASSRQSASITVSPTPSSFASPQKGNRLDWQSLRMPLRRSDSEPGGERFRQSHRTLSSVTSHGGSGRGFSTLVLG
jgi:hypothetical protein